MSPPVFKTGGSGDPRPAGSIPVRLRQRAEASSPKPEPYLTRPRLRRSPAGSIPVRLRPSSEAPSPKPARTLLDGFSHCGNHLGGQPFDLLVSTRPYGLEVHRSEAEFGEADQSLGYGIR